MILYDYPLSSASYRVRIGLALKGIVVSVVSKRLRENEHQAGDYLALNPQGFVPALALDDQVTVLTQSLAILEYLEEMHPEPALLPRAPAARAHVRALCQLIACDVHPLNNLRVLRYLERDLALGAEARTRWYGHWVTAGLTAFEAFLQRAPARYCCGDTPTLADVCLVPQVFNARRFAVDLSPFPRVVAVDAACALLPAFARAAPHQASSTR
ncbi:MAG TPA: maleylacetoacetate isomerase [Steroidobacteraceae bacterium]|nr:maleylacetoacetate isomerase [Steroidobacteraceae bacterium]